MSRRNEPPSVSVFIPTYNYAEFLAQAIDSALVQTVPPLEILVADDGSTDATPDVVARFGDRVRGLRFPHIGLGAVRSQMLLEVKGDWFLNLDADNRIAPDFLERMLDAIATHGGEERLAFFYPDIELIGTSAGRVERPDFAPQRLKQGNYLDMNALVRTDVGKRFRFDPAFNEGQGDYDFFLSLVKSGYVGCRVPAAILQYRVHEKSITHALRSRRSQVHTMRRIVAKHHDFFSPDERRAAVRAAGNRLLVTLIAQRTPFAGPGRRLLDWLHFARVGWRHAEFRKQTLYTFSPSRYFRATRPAADAVFLFRDLPARREMMAKVNAGQPLGLERSQLFGYDLLQARGLQMGSNLADLRVSSVREQVIAWADRRYAARAGVGLGDLCAVLAYRDAINRARVVVATTDNTGLAALRLKATGLIKTPLVYISVGLPERIMAVQRRSAQRASGYCARMKHADCIVAYGWAEAEWLKTWVEDDTRVRFIPFGVDTEQWCPVAMQSEHDVISVGFDPHRDFALLLDYARRRPAVSVLIVTGAETARQLGSVPGNVSVHTDFPLDKVQHFIAASSIVALPIRENTYTAGTTTLLQCMAMAKPVAVSKVGAIRDGYGLEDGAQVRWMAPGSQEACDLALDALLADPDGAHALGQRARDHVCASLDWKVYAERLHSCMQEIAR